MEILGLIIPFIASVGWLLWLRHTDRLAQEPWELVLNTFALGSLAGFIGLAALTGVVLIEPDGLWSTKVVLLAPLNVAFITLVLRLLPYRRPEWNEPIDGVVYGGAAGLGYGLAYTLLLLFTDPLSGFRSAVFTVPIYMLAGLIAGYYLSQVRFGISRTGFKGFVIATLYLGGIELARTWGGDVMGSAHPLASAVVYGTNTIGWVMAMWAMDQSNRDSWYGRASRRLLLADRACQACGSQLVSGGAYCTHCGRPDSAQGEVQP